VFIPSGKPSPLYNMQNWVDLTRNYYMKQIYITNRWPSHTSTADDSALRYSPLQPSYVGYRWPKQATSYPPLFCFGTGLVKTRSWYREHELTTLIERNKAKKITRKATKHDTKNTLNNRQNIWNWKQHSQQSVSNRNNTLIRSCVLWAQA